MGDVLQIPDIGCFTIAVAMNRVILRTFFTAANLIETWDLMGSCALEKEIGYQ